MEDVPFVKSMKYLNQKDKDWYYLHIEQWTLFTLIKTLLINFDNFLGYKFKNKQTEGD